MRETAMRSAIGTVLNREEKVKKQRRQRMIQVYQRKFLICAVLLFLAVNTCGIMMVNAFADETASQARQPYYTSIRIQEGDSLWSIASRYAPQSPMDTREYVMELKKMNRLAGDTIHAGHYLTIVYYE
ncbi:MAG: LysM peptidoglycan-binding domain-containing protein [Lachnospiraceae bacterium]|nr:LysM peptidoglycan-binding domain-containing protein [Lachnospiraceae bacterium]